MYSERCGWFVGIRCERWERKISHLDGPAVVRQPLFLGKDIAAADLVVVVVDSSDICAAKPGNLAHRPTCTKKGNDVSL